MEKVLQFCVSSRDEIHENRRIFSGLAVVKIISSLYNGGGESSGRYSVHFDDGITVLIVKKGDGFEYENMLSTGLNSVLFTKGWPKGKNLDKRFKMACEFVTNNIKRNRYKKRK